MDLGVQGQRSELFADIPSHRDSFLHVGWSPQPVVLADCRSITEFDHPHFDVHVLSDQNYLPQDTNQVGEVPHTSSNRTILYRNFLQCRSLVSWRGM